MDGTGRAGQGCLSRPGNRRSDGGASANGLVEKNLTLKIAQYCKEELEKYAGVTVYMTRSTDVAVDLEERVQKAKNWGGGRMPDGRPTSLV